MDNTQLDLELSDKPPAADSISDTPRQPVIAAIPEPDIARAAHQVVKLVDRIVAAGHEPHQVFDDLLEFGCCALLGDDDRHAAVMAHGYSREEVNLFAEALGHIWAEAQKGYHDILGPAYEELSSHHKRAGFGQYFTPWAVALMMAEITIDPEPKRHEDGSPLTVCDPCVGAGVMLLAAAAVIEARNPELLATGGVGFYGQDIDNTCCRMAELNLLAHGLMNRSQVMAAILTAPERAKAEVERRDAA